VLLSLAYHFGSPPPRRLPVQSAPPPPPPAIAAAPPPAPSLFLVFFEFDRASLTEAGAATVQQAADYFKQRGAAQIQIAGYTDLAGSQQYNLRLSKRRADTVRAYLNRLSVPNGAIDESWHGKENPRVPTPDGVREPQNRRVEIVVP